MISAAAEVFTPSHEEGASTAAPLVNTEEQVTLRNMSCNCHKASDSSFFSSTCLWDKVTSCCPCIVVACWRLMMTVPTTMTITTATMLVALTVSYACAEHLSAVCIKLQTDLGACHMQCVCPVMSGPWLSLAHATTCCFDNDRLYDAGRQACWAVG